VRELGHRERLPSFVPVAVEDEPKLAVNRFTREECEQAHEITRVDPTRVVLQAELAKETGLQHRVADAVALEYQTERPRANMLRLYCRPEELTQLHKPIGAQIGGVFRVSNQLPPTPSLIGSSTYLCDDCEGPHILVARAKAVARHAKVITAPSDGEEGRRGAVFPPGRFLL
jgi:hypothetical protein